MKVNIVIPTYNRAHCVGQAVDAALNQVYSDIAVTVIDDGSQDDTADVMGGWRDHPRLTYARLSRNCGTAKAKNLAIALSNCDAITFHDSDDIPTPIKLLLQVRALSRKGTADEILDWRALGHEPGKEIQIDVAVGAHKFVQLDGSVYIIDKQLSLVDDFFPTLQSPSKTAGDWILINSGLFRRHCFSRLGGYLDSVEEDRELRNRLIASGHLFHFIAEPLLTKIEMEVSLTTSGSTSYRSGKRKADRDEVWRRNRIYRNGAWGQDAILKGRVPIELEDVEIAEIRNGDSLRVANDIPMTEKTRVNLDRELSHSLRSGIERARTLQAVGRPSRIRAAISFRNID